MVGASLRVCTVLTGSCPCMHAQNKHAVIRTATLRLPPHPKHCPSCSGGSGRWAGWHAPAAQRPVAAGGGRAGAAALRRLGAAVSMGLLMLRSAATLVRWLRWPSPAYWQPVYCSRPAGFCQRTPIPCLHLPNLPQAVWHRCSRLPGICPSSSSGPAAARRGSWPDSCGASAAAAHS